MTRDQLLQHALQFDSELFVDRIMTFDEEANGALSQERVLASVGSVLGAAALVLLVIGLYGTMAAAVDPQPPRARDPARARRQARARSALWSSSAACSSPALALGWGCRSPTPPRNRSPTCSTVCNRLDPLVGAVTVAIVLATAASRGQSCPPVALPGSGTPAIRPDRRLSREPRTASRGLRATMSPRMDRGTDRV